MRAKFPMRLSLLLLVILALSTFASASPNSNPAGTYQYPPSVEEDGLFFSEAAWTYLGPPAVEYVQNWVGTAVCGNIHLCATY